MMKTSPHPPREASTAPRPIDALRRDIDAIDEAILDLINRRLSLARQIGTHKKAQGDPVLDRNRENEILNRLGALNPGPLDGDTLGHIFRRIIAVARSIQE